MDGMNRFVAFVFGLVLIGPSAGAWWAWGDSRWVCDVVVLPVLLGLWSWWMAASWSKEKLENFTEGRR